ncbi:MAG TPA: lysophospholipase [Blastocatellia bacterium]|nr:lysophospholipase [Blastocatellia bacterium]
MAQKTFTEETIATSDGLRLYVRRRQVEPARACVIIVHGFGEHSGRYGALTDHLTSRCYSVVAYDHRGHGLSDGLPGHVESFTEYEEDLDKIVAYARAQGESRTVYLVGHSMGGLITLRYARKNMSVAGAIVSSPLVGMAVAVPAHRLMIASVSARMAPRFRMDNGLDPALLSRDPEVGRAYAADPLVNRKVSARWFVEASRAMEELKRMASEISLPVLVMHGTGDRIASVDATKRLFEKIGSSDKELEIYEGFYHELFNEPEKLEVFERVTRWLDQRAG